MFFGRTVTITVLPNRLSCRTDSWKKKKRRKKSPSVSAGQLKVFAGKWRKASRSFRKIRPTFRRVNNINYYCVAEEDGFRRVRVNQKLGRVNPGGAGAYWSAGFSTGRRCRCRFHNTTTPRHHPRQMSTNVILLSLLLLWRRRHGIEPSGPVLSPRAPLTPPPTDDDLKTRTRKGRKRRLP